MPRLLILFENAIGLSVFDCKGINEVAVTENSVQKSFLEFNLFSQMAQMISFYPFTSTEVALDTLNLITEGQVSEYMRQFLTTVIPDQLSKHKHGVVLGVSDPKLAGTITNELNIQCKTGDTIREIIRGIRQNFDHYMDTITPEDVKQAQLGLSHGFSRQRVKFNQHGDDNMVISAVALLTSLDKDINTFAMRLREWYSVHFPELSRLIADHQTFAKAVIAVGRRSTFTPEALSNLLHNDALTESIVSASQNSIGREIDDTDLARVMSMAERVDGLLTFKQRLSLYLKSRMHSIAPNLTSLIGEKMGAQLIAASSSLTNLAKSPSSTVQILGSEKALFNALKKRKPTPKYGILYNAAQVLAAAPEDKGRTARSLSNKISIASRIDAFGDDFRGGFLGELMKDMMEVRSEQSKKGQKTEPNLEAMIDAVSKAREMEKNAPENKAAQNEEKAPEAKVPEAKAPEAKAPEVAIQEAKQLETEQTEGKKHHRRHSSEGQSQEEVKAVKATPTEEKKTEEAKTEEAKPEANEEEKHHKHHKHHSSQEESK